MYPRLILQQTFSPIHTAFTPQVKLLLLLFPPFPPFSSPAMFRKSLSVACWAVCALSLPVAAQDSIPRNPPGFVGPTDAGYLLPNGWRVTPAGRQVLLTDL